MADISKLNEDGLLASIGPLADWKMNMINTIAKLGLNLSEVRFEDWPDKIESFDGVFQQPKNVE